MKNFRRKLYLVEWIVPGLKGQEWNMDPSSSCNGIRKGIEGDDRGERKNVVKNTFKEVGE